MARLPVSTLVVAICMALILVTQSAQAQSIVFLEPIVSADTAGDRAVLSQIADAVVTHFESQRIRVIRRTELRVNEFPKDYLDQGIEYYVSAVLAKSDFGISVKLKYFALDIDVDSTSPHTRKIASHTVVMSSNDLVDVLHRLKVGVLYQFIKVIVAHSQRSAKEIVVAACFYPMTEESSVKSTSANVTTRYHQKLREAPFGDRFNILGIDAPDEYQSSCINQNDGAALGLGGAYDHHISGFVLANGTQLSVIWQTLGSNQRRTSDINGRNLSPSEIVDAVVREVTEMAPTN